VEGYVSTDNIGLQGETPGQMSFIPVDIGKDLEGAQADGIAGMAPIPSEGASLFVENLVNTGVIDAKEFTVFIGKEGVNASFIEFGKNQDDQKEVTFIPLVPVQEELPQTYWNVKLDEFRYGDVVIGLDTTNTVWDTGTSLIGFKQTNLLNLVLKIANGKEIFVVQGSYYAIKCNSVNEIEDLKFKFGEKTIIVNKNEFVMRSQGYCIFLFVVLSDDQPTLDVTLLGDAFLRGVKTIHDMENQQMGIFPQILYEYKDSHKSSLLWLYILLGCIGVLIIALGAFCLWKQLTRKRRRSPMAHEGYEEVRIGGNL
jgi:hypothetical protein